MKEDNHLTFNDICLYIDNEEVTKENEGKIIDIGTHLADCEFCVERVKAHLRLNIILENWTPLLHGYSYREKFLNSLCKKGIEISQSTEIQNRIEQWFGNLQGISEAAFEIIMDLKDEITKISKEGMGLFNKPNSKWDFGPGIVLEPSRSGSESKQFIDETMFVDKNSPNNKIILDAFEEKLEIKLGRIEELPKIPLVLLVSEQDIEDLRIKEPQFDPDLKSWIVIFNNIKEGKYLLLFEPL